MKYVNLEMLIFNLLEACKDGTASEDGFVLEKPPLKTIYKVIIIDHDFKKCVQLASQLTFKDKHTRKDVMHELRNISDSTMEVS